MLHKFPPVCCGNPFLDRRYLPFLKRKVIENGL